MVDNPAAPCHKRAADFAFSDKLHIPIAVGQNVSRDKDISEGQVVKSLDYRGVRVLSVTRWIPNTPWLMVSKVDEDEVFAPLRREAYEIGIISALFLLVIVLGIGSLWRQQKLVNARTNELRLRTLIEQAPLAINISRAGKSIYANQKFLDFYGYQSVEELFGRSYSYFLGARIPGNDQRTFTETRTRRTGFFGL